MLIAAGQTLSRAVSVLQYSRVYSSTDAVFRRRQTRGERRADLLQLVFRRRAGRRRDQRTGAGRLAAAQPSQETGGTHGAGPRPVPEGNRFSLQNKSTGLHQFGSSSPPFLVSSP